MTYYFLLGGGPLIYFPIPLPTLSTSLERGRRSNAFFYSCLPVLLNAIPITMNHLPRLESGRCEGLTQVGAGTMTVTRVSLKTPIKMALLLYPGLPRWKRWRLQNPERIKPK